MVGEEYQPKSAMSRPIFAENNDICGSLGELVNFVWFGRNGITDPPPECPVTAPFHATPLTLCSFVSPFMSLVVKKAFS